MHPCQRLLGTSGSSERALFAKVDLQNAYRIVPVHPDDHHLLGFQWNNRVFRDTALLFDLRSAPKILFSSCRCSGVDSALRKRHTPAAIFGHFPAPGCPKVASMCESLTYHTCAELGVPIAADKTEPQSTFLDIQIDSTGMEGSLPVNKLARTIATVQSWTCKKAASKRELQSL